MTIYSGADLTFIMIFIMIIFIKILHIISGKLSTKKRKTIYNKAASRRQINLESY
jgi:hypothetical protein